MTASDMAMLALASCFACACAEGYGASVASFSNAATALPPSGGSGGAGGDTSSGGMSGMSGLGGMGGMPAPLGDPCTRNDRAPCACEGSDAQGQRVCLFDMASPTQGFFSECQGCPPPGEPVDPPEPSCTDGTQNGAETSADCGGGECSACPLASACAVDTDCAVGMCVGSVCTMQSSGAGGASGGAGGASGSGGGDSGSGGEPPIDEPVESCDGVPEGTECDRDCILPSNTARCNSRGNCSCL